MTRRSAVAVSIAALFVALAAPARAQQVSRCASCHFANLERVPAAHLLGDWAQSSHGRRSIGCERCHGGNAWSEHPYEAHRGIVNPADEQSPVNPANLVSTCAQCHRANADAFGDSVHQTLLAAGDRRAPTCATCHSAMRARTISGMELESRCAGCHGATTARREDPAAMRAGVEALEALRLRCDRLDEAVKRVRDQQDRLTLGLAVAALRHTLNESVAATHGFNVVEVHERNAAARQQVDAIAEALVFAR